MGDPGGRHRPLTFTNVVGVLAVVLAGWVIVQRMSRPGREDRARSELREHLERFAREEDPMQRSMQATQIANGMEQVAEVGLRREAWDALVGRAEIEDAPEVLPQLLLMRERTDPAAPADLAARLDALVERWRRLGYTITIGPGRSVRVAAPARSLGATEGAD